MRYGLDCCRYSQRLPPYLAYSNAGLLATSIYTSGRSCDQPACSSFFAIFVGPGASAELVPKFYLALNSSLEVLPKFLSKTQPTQCCKDFFSQCSPLSTAFKIQPYFSPPFLCFVLLQSASNHLSSFTTNAVPFLQSICTRRTRGHCQETFITIKFCVRPCSKRCSSVYRTLPIPFFILQSVFKELKYFMKGKTDFSR